MDYSVLMALALQGLTAVLNLVGSLKAQSGMADDAILAAAQSTVGANDQTYATLKAHLASLPPAS
jgi:hypothetical protein